MDQLEKLNYPDPVKREKLSGTVQFTLGIRSDGSLESVEINRSSGNKALEEEAIRFAKLAGKSGFAPFPAKIRQDVDILHITRTLAFKEPPSK
ncbi:MAG: energy transducer TonB [Nitrosomonadaceae bacterium]